MLAHFSKKKKKRTTNYSLYDKWQALYSEILDYS